MASLNSEGQDRRCIGLRRFGAPSEKCGVVLHGWIIEGQELSGGSNSRKAAGLNVVTNSNSTTIERDCAHD